MTEELESQPIPDEARCPRCGAEPTEESLIEDHLSDLGYTHNDKNFECSECDKRWQCGIPIGDPPDAARWECPSCGGRFIPHFGALDMNEAVLKVRPKCEDCNYVPDIPLHIEMSVTEDQNYGRVFFGHPTVTGDTDAGRDNGWANE